MFLLVGLVNERTMKLAMVWGITSLTFRKLHLFENLVLSSTNPGCLKGILTMAYYNPIIPFYKSTTRVPFIASFQKKGPTNS